MCAWVAMLMYVLSSTEISLVITTSAMNVRILLTANCNKSDGSFRYYLIAGVVKIMETCTNPLDLLNMPKGRK